MICYVTRYDRETRKAVGEPMIVEAGTKAEAVEKAYGFKVAPAGLRMATASVVCLGDKPTDRQYFRKV